MTKSIATRLLTSRHGRLILVLAIFIGFWWTFPASEADLPKSADKIARHNDMTNLAATSPRRAMPKAYGEVAATTPDSRFAFATFLSGDDDMANVEDEYYRATRLLVYQVLHANDTKSGQKLPFLVVVTGFVPQWKREKLAEDGATVVAVDDVPLKPWISITTPRWKDQFTKLRVLEMTQYDRVLYLDADIFVTAPLDGVFQTPEARLPSRSLLRERPGEIHSDEGQLPVNYVFCGRPDNDLLGGPDHKFPPGHHDLLNAGFWVAAPSTELYRYLLSIMDVERRFDAGAMEQSLLNYALRQGGAMPWCELDPYWTATWANEHDLAAGVRSLHGKFWKEGSVELRARYAAAVNEMETFYNTTRPGLRT